MSTDLSPEALRKQTLPQLRALCKAHGLKCGGNKAQLIDRLTASASAPQAPSVPDSVITDAGVEDNGTPAVDPAFVTPKKERKRKAETVDARAEGQVEAPAEENPAADRVRSISMALAKSIKKIQNFVWLQGTGSTESSQEEREEASEPLQITQATLLADYLKEHEQLFMALSHDCRASFDCANALNSANVLLTFMKSLEAVDKALLKLAQLELSCDLEHFFKDICVMVDGNLEAPRILPFGEAITYCWFLLGLCATMVDQSQPVVSSILNTLDDRGVDLPKCHTEFENEAHGFMLSEQAWQRLQQLFEDKTAWKISPKKRNAPKKMLAAPAA